MTSNSLALPSDYWQSLSITKQDLEFIHNHLFEVETPLTTRELLGVLVDERIHSEQETLLKKKQAGGKIYYPKERYKADDRLIFPALNWKKGKVLSLRAGVNPHAGKFDVIEVEFEQGQRKQFATNLAEHELNQPVEILADGQHIDPIEILKDYGRELELVLLAALETDEGLVSIAGHWFPRALLVDVNKGHLNLAEAVLDEAGGKPLSASALLEHVGLPANFSPKLVEFSFNFSLQKDERFDEVGPAGEVLWCLRRLEPEEVQQIPAPLRYLPIEYDRSILTDSMLMLEGELNDELSEQSEPAGGNDEVIISLTYPHWRAGTLPVSARVRSLFPTAYESPRICFTLVDGHTEKEMPAWVVRTHGYVYGLAGWYRELGLIPGSLIAIRRGKKPGQVIVDAKTRRPTRDWVRTVLVGSDGGIVFAMLKQTITADYNERMVIAVPDVELVDKAWAQKAKEHLSFEQVVLGMMRELTKLNLQGHVHAQELYSALNIVWRCPPAPLLSHLAVNSNYIHVGDLHFRLETPA